MFDTLKTLLRDVLHVPPSLALALAGLLAHLLLDRALGRPWTAPHGLFAALALGIALEGWEIWVAYRAIGLLAPGNDPLWVILARHATDVAAMLVLPLLLVLGGWVRRG